jgi:hypothetical protein
MPSVALKPKPCPSTGSGDKLVWKWLLATASHYKKVGKPESDTVALLVQGVLANPDNEHRQQIEHDARQAVRKVFGGDVLTGPAVCKTEANWANVEYLIGRRTETLDYWRQISPLAFDDADASAANRIVAELFPSELIAVARDPAYCYIIRQTKHQVLSGFAFIAHNPMRSIEGGRREDNVLERRWCVIEWDIKPDRNPAWAALLGRLNVDPFTAQSRLIAHIAGDYAEFPLKLIVYSGSSSLHAWFNVKGATGADIQQFITSAEALGADGTTKSAHQLFRMPHGTNQKTKKRQSIIYYATK